MVYLKEYFINYNVRHHNKRWLLRYLFSFLINIYFNFSTRHTLQGRDDLSR